MNADSFRFLLNTLEQLREAHIYYELSNNRYDAISVNVAVPGQRWELDFLSDGSVEVEVFRSDGTIYDDKSIKELIEQFSDLESGDMNR